ncbi:MAG: glycoside hydrolase family 57 protein [Chloroflexota bacterium]
MTPGYLVIALHAHLPFVRHPEYDHALEENWLYEAIIESYVPLILMIERLLDDGIDFRVTFSITPTLSSMFEDPYLQSRCVERVESLIELAHKEIRRTKSEPSFRPLSVMYKNLLQKVRQTFVDRYRCNLTDAFRKLQESGKIEIIASAATHGYLPLLSSHPSSVRGQVKVGASYHQRTFGKRPAGFWLPECGFYPGLDELLGEERIRYCVLETHGVTRARPRPRHGVYAPIFSPSGVAFFGRDPSSSRQVWSSIEGYPGDHDYREFYRDVAFDLGLDYIGPYVHHSGTRFDTGFKYYRITGKTQRKEPYSPQRADQKARLHAEHFVAEKIKDVTAVSASMDRPPLIVAPYDAELFGHWWFEGPKWLDHVIRNVARQQKKIRLVTLSEYLAEYPVNQIAVPSSSSWGNKGYHTTWHNWSNEWIYRHLDRGGLVMERLASRHPRARGFKLRALRQAARELLLAQASDWAFMINSGSMKEYATRRTKTHLLRLHRLAHQIESGRIDREWLVAIEKQDDIFPEIDYRDFA